MTAENPHEGRDHSPGGRKKGGRKKREGQRAESEDLLNAPPGRNDPISTMGDGHVKVKDFKLMPRREPSTYRNRIQESTVAAPPALRSKPKDPTRNQQLNRAGTFCDKGGFQRESGGESR